MQPVCIILFTITINIKPKLNDGYNIYITKNVRDGNDNDANIGKMCFESVVSGLITFAHKVTSKVPNPLQMSQRAVSMVRELFTLTLHNLLL